MHKTNTLSRAPSDVMSAMVGAERELKPPPDGKTQQVQILPRLITTRPELFQPRCFWSGSLDKEHVDDLTQRIESKGELDPPLVVKLGRKWVCVDGHHRLAAYRKTDKYDFTSNYTITCEWFPGSVREAVDESIRRNDIAKLEMRPGDRYEAAWQRVVMGWGSKREIAHITNVSDGLIAEMRRVVNTYEANNSRGKELREKLRGGLAQHTWSAAKIAYHNWDRSGWDAREAGAKLAKRLRNSLHDRLTENPIVTAHALMIYDPKLPKKLIEAFNKIESQDRETQSTSEGST